MLQYMETVSQGEAENIRKTIQDLFRQTCILQVKCDPATLVQHDNPRYQVCLRHREFIADYLSVLDCELVHDPQEHIFRITGDGVMTERMSLMTTKLVILLKMIYRDKSWGKVCMQLPQIWQKSVSMEKIQTLLQDVSRGRSGTMHLF